MSTFARPGQPQLPSQLYSPPMTTTSSLNYSAYNHTPGAMGGGTGGGGYASTSRNVSASSQSLPMGGGGGAGIPRVNTAGNGSGVGAGGGSAAVYRSQGSERKVESKEVARVHWKALRGFLASWLKEAREKLTRLTKLQFQELSTDVYDELMRRLQAEHSSPEDAVPFLPVRDDFHPKRNQARQKLATLPRNRFKDLASDVYFELKRRYPEFEDDEGQDDDYAQSSSSMPAQRPPMVTTQSAPDQIRARINPTPPPLARLQTAAVTSGSHQRSNSRNLSSSSISTHRSRPSRERNGPGQGYDRGDEMEQLDNRGGAGGAGPSGSQGQSQGQGRGMNPVGATSDMVVPNKSRMREEEIEVPYARDSVLEAAPSIRSVSRTSARDRDRERMRDRDRDRESLASAGTSISARQGPPLIPPVMPAAAAASGSSRPIINPNDTLSPTMTDDREYYDRMSFSSNVTGKSRMAGGGGAGSGWDEEREQKIRQEYEFRVVGLERKLGIVEGERDELKRVVEGERERRAGWDEEMRGLKERATTHASSLRSLQHELDIARDAASTARSHAEHSNRQGEEEIASWRDRCDALEDEVRRLEEDNAALRDEVAGGGGGGTDGDVAGELKKELHSLVDELNSLSMRNDQLMMEREQDAAGMNEMEARVEEYRRKYEAVRIELRNLKATSTMFVSKPLTDDHLPASPDGNIGDVHVSAFQAGIDGLLAAARSSAPSGVLPAMKAVVEAITEIGEDVKNFEAKPNLDVDSSRLEHLKHESTTRLSGLMQAARNHAMASGLSPVSLLDAAAGHLSANVVEIIKLLKIKRTVRRSRSSLSIKEMVGRDAKGANGNFDREYGTAAAGGGGGGSVSPDPPRSDSRAQDIRIQQERERERSASAASLSAGGSRPPITRTQLSDRNTPSPVPIPPANVPQQSNTYLGGQISQPLRSLQEPSHLRTQITSYQSASSQARSDSFDLERKASVVSNPRDAPRPVVEPRFGQLANGYHNAQAAPNGGQGRSFSGTGPDRNVPSRNGARGPSEESDASSAINPGTARSVSRGGQDISPPQVENGERSPGLGYAQGEGSEEEWEELKPYLNSQSSALVNSIQNLLAAIRTNQQTPALTEHLSEVIAIASSIVAVAGNALPANLRYEGEGLLKGLVSDTNKLSEAQEAARGAGFGKDVRQGIAAASFGVAKGLKSLMKLGVE